VRAILTYHSIDPSGSAVSVDPEAFAGQLAWLAREDVQVVTLDTLLALPHDTRAVAITFDDALANIATEAAPWLAERGWPATVFVPTRHVGRDNQWQAQGQHTVPVLPLLDWEGLGRLTEAGWTVGAHTRHHARLPACADAALADELEGAVADITTHLGSVPRWLAYPFGDMDRRVRDAAAQWFTGACTTVLRPLGGGDDPLALPRLDAYYLTPRVCGLPWGGETLRRYLAVRRLLRDTRAWVAARSGRAG
jgi:peptidoglycan/xylan/chitin deacetylase (PgdA/CDA1 family)